MRAPHRGRPNLARGWRTCWAALLVAALFSTAVQAASGGYFSPGYLADDTRWGFGGGGFGGTGAVVVGGDGFSVSLPDGRMGLGLLFVASPVTPRPGLLLLPSAGIGGGGDEQGGGWFVLAGLRVLYFPTGKGYASGLSVDYLVPVAGQPPRGWLVRVLVGGGRP